MRLWNLFLGLIIIMVSRTDLQQMQFSCPACLVAGPHLIFVIHNPSLRGWSPACVTLTLETLQHQACNPYPTWTEINIQRVPSSVPSHNLLNGRTCHRENTEMPPQLTFLETRDEAQKSEQQQPQGAVKKLGVIFSQFAVHANNTMWCGRKKGVEPAPSVGGCWHIDNCLGLSSPLLSAQCISHTGALASGQSESGHHTVNTWGVKLRREEFSTRGDLCQWQQVTLSYMGEKIK